MLSPTNCNIEFSSPELEIHQSKGLIGKDVLILTLEDPKEGLEVAEQRWMLYLWSQSISVQKLVFGSVYRSLLLDADKF